MTSYELFPRFVDVVRNSSITGLQLWHIASHDSNIGGRGFVGEPRDRSKDAGIPGVVEQVVSGKLSGQTTGREKQYKPGNLCEF